MDKKRTQQYTIRLCCLLASFALWLYIYNVINPIKVDKFRKVTVTLKNTDVLSQFKLTLIPNQEFYTDLTVTGSVEDMAKVSGEDFKLEADLDGFGFKKGDTNKIPVKVVQKPDNVQISNTDLLYVNISTDGLTEKTLPIKSEVNGKVKDGYYAFFTSFNPKTVLIDGGAKLVKSVTSVIATTDIGGADSSLKKTVVLKAVDENGTEVKGVILNPSKVEATTSIKKIKTVPIVVKTKNALNKNYILKSIVPADDNIEVAVDDVNNSNITSIETVPLALDTLTGSSDTQLNLVVPDGVKLINNKGSISVKITMSKIITKTVSQDIKTKNLADTLKVTLDNTKVNLVISGDESIINAIKDGDIDSSVDLNALGEVIDLVVPVVIKVPTGVTVVSQSPQTVKLVIAKK